MKEKKRLESKIKNCSTNTATTNLICHISGVHHIQLIDDESSSDEENIKEDFKLKDKDNVSQKTSKNVA